jgi:hypothetical protein
MKKLARAWAEAHLRKIWAKTEEKHGINCSVGVLNSGRSDQGTGMETTG